MHALLSLKPERASAERKPRTQGFSTQLGAPQSRLVTLQHDLGNQAMQHLLHSGAIRAKLAIGHPNDQYEREADRVADQVMRMPGSAARVQRMCACGGTSESAGECEGCARKRLTLQRYPAHQAEPADVPSIVHDVFQSSGQPLNADTRAFFEPRFGYDFSRVRVYTDARAAESARAVNALAYTAGRDVVFGAGQYAPESTAGKRLLAHELAHVVQQDGGDNVSGQKTGSPGRVIRRQTIHSSCVSHQSDINSGWAEAVRMVSETIDTLEAVRSAMSLPEGAAALMPRPTRYIVNSFGDVGGLQGGGFTKIGTVIDKYRTIQSGFTGGKTLRCDPQTIGATECDWRSAFVVRGNRTDIFLCPSFLAPTETSTGRGATLIHEMAHLVLNATHEGLAERTFPAAFFDCEVSLELEFDQAKKNAFAYEILANCLHGSQPSSSIEVPRTESARSAALARDFRWSISGLGGAALEPELQGLAGLSGRLSLRTGSLVVFNPTIGLNILYSPSSEIQPQEFLLAVAHMGLRVQQPLRGAYLDVTGGGFWGFDAEAGKSREFTGGLGLGLGAGWRWERVELGAEANTLFPLTANDPTRILILGRLGIRFGQ